jgi:F0F1-type ATP synthase membrane subunit c/vacuolar-type H+-ATPase subunit K
MQNILLLAHAGVEHASEAEATSHKTTSSLTIVLVGSALVIFGLVIAVRILSKSPKNNKQHTQDTTQE